MARRRRIGGAYLLGSLLVLTASLHPATAYSAAGDPPSGSPAGAVYELPLEGGRADAAPKGNGETTGGTGAGSTGSAAGGQGEAGSLYRSENNFGSSSRVPGASAGAAGDTGQAAGGAGKGANGAGAPPAGSGGSGTIAAQTADTGNTSVSAGIVLLGAIGLLAAAIAVLSRRFSRGRAGTP